MDVRDITQEVPNIGNKGFSMMMNLQEELLKEYIKIESLPQYPIEINTKASQILFKDFIARIVEELGEAYESMEKYLDHAEREGRKNNIQNFNEECADALHFMLETFIYIGLEGRSIIRHIQLQLQEKDVCFLTIERITGGIEGDALEATMNYLEREHPNDCRKPFQVQVDGFHEEFLRGGQNMKWVDKTKLAQLFWDVTYYLQLARNSLKNKPWKQTGMVTDRTVFIENMIKSWIALIRAFRFLHMTPQSIFHIYFKKNLVNQFRQRSKY